MSKTSRANKNITSKDTRTIKQYLEDVAEIERRGTSPTYSKERKQIIIYWQNAIKKRLVSPEDKMYKAIEKMRQIEKRQPETETSIYRQSETKSQQNKKIHSRMITL